MIGSTVKRVTLVSVDWRKALLPYVSRGSTRLNFIFIYRLKYIFVPAFMVGNTAQKLIRVEKRWNRVKVDQICVEKCWRRVKKSFFDTEKHRSRVRKYIFDTE